jgi:hypothetical protein
MRNALREYREMLWVLNEHEGWRSRRWPLAAVGVFAGVWAVPLTGAIASAYVARAGDGFGWVALSATVTLGLGGLGVYWSRNQPWRRVIADRVWAYGEQADPTDYSRAMIGRDDYERAMHELRRAGLEARGGTSYPPPGAPRLDTRLYVFRPIAVPAGQERATDATRRVLHDAGIDGRVDGFLTNGEPVPIVAPGVYAGTEADRGVVRSPA